MSQATVESKNNSEPSFSFDLSNEGIVLEVNDQNSTKSVGKATTVDTQKLEMKENAFVYV